jgi:hypothetical protein
MKPKEHETELLVTLAWYTGMRWSFADADKRLLGVAGRWQLMPLQPADDDHPFWSWHLDHARQWFDSKNAAAVSLLASWARYADATSIGCRDGAGRRDADFQSLDK